MRVYLRQINVCWQSKLLFNSLNASTAPDCTQKQYLHRNLQKLLLAILLMSLGHEARCEITCIWYFRSGKAKLSLANLRSLSGA